MTDLHVHTTYCDGADTPEETVKAAISLGMECVGFSAHSHVPFDEFGCMKKEAYAEYKREIDFLKKKYAGRIKILCGIEQDYCSNMPFDGFDYAIGSVHYVKAGSEYFAADDTREILIDGAEKYFGGDILAVAEEYFRAVANPPKGINIIGHFDLISKFNKNESLFSETDERYVSAYKRAIDALLPLDIPFEVNTGAISRGYKDTPYPSEAQLEYIREKGGRVILSSDSHSKDTLCYGFEAETERLRKIGFRF